MNKLKLYIVEILQLLIFLLAFPVAMLKGIMEEYQVELNVDFIDRWYNKLTHYKTFKCK